MMTIWHHRQPWHFFISAVYHTEWMPFTSNIAGVYNIGFLDTQSQSDCHFYICCSFALKPTKWLKTCWKTVACSFVELSSALLKLCPTKSCATFYGPPDIVGIVINSVPSNFLIELNWKAVHLSVKISTWIGVSEAL